MRPALDEVVLSSSLWYISMKDRVSRSCTTSRVRGALPRVQLVPRGGELLRRIRPDDAMLHCAASRLKLNERSVVLIPSSFWIFCFDMDSGTLTPASRSFSTQQQRNTATKLLPRARRTAAW